MRVGIFRSRKSAGDQSLFINAYLHCNERMFCSRVQRMTSTEHKTHSHPEHTHGPDCGHEAVPHDDHVDYLHDGHRHAPHGDHYDEH
jgi:hypothetical protein